MKGIYFDKEKSKEELPREVMKTKAKMPEQKKIEELERQIKAMKRVKAFTTTSNMQNHEFYSILCSELESAISELEKLKSMNQQHEQER